MRCAIYARVSTPKQVKKGSSLPAQIKSCREYCADNDYEVVGEWIDEAEHSEDKSRPELDDLASKITDLGINAIVYKDQERAMRGVIAAGRFQELEDYYGVLIIDVLNPGMSSLVRNVRAAVTGETQRVLRKKIGDSLRDKQEKLEGMGGHPPIGYKYVNHPTRKKVLTPEPSEARKVRKMFEAADPRAGRTLTEVYRAAGFEATRARRLLRNPQYIGCYVANRWVKVPGRQREPRKRPPSFWRERPRDEWKVTPGSHPAIVDEALFNRVQKRMESNSKRRKHGAGYSHLPLSGLLRCGRCGQDMVIANEGRKRRLYYCCRGSMPRFRGREGVKPCEGVGEFLRTRRAVIPTNWVPKLAILLAVELAKPQWAAAIAEEENERINSGEAVKNLERELRSARKRAKGLERLIDAGEVGKSKKSARKLREKWDAAIEQQERIEGELKRAEKQQHAVSPEEVHKSMLWRARSLEALITNATHAVLHVGDAACKKAARSAKKTSQGIDVSVHRSLAKRLDEQLGSLGELIEHITVPVGVEDGESPVVQLKRGAAVNLECETAGHAHHRQRLHQ